MLRLYRQIPNAGPKIAMNRSKAIGFETDFAEDDGVAVGDGATDDVATGRGAVSHTDM